MLLKSLAILSVLSVSFNVVPAQQQGKLIKYVDKELRMTYYKVCREQKLKRCHTKSFENSIKLKWEK